jgi:hypothetical protein
MSLKQRYAAFFLLVLLLLVVFCIAAVSLVYRGDYLAAGLLLVLLYLTTYLLGKRFAKIFFVLSFLKLLKQKNGVFSRNEFELYVEKSVGSRRSPEKAEALKHEILQTMTAEKLISIEGDTILLLVPYS